MPDPDHSQNAVRIQDVHKIVAPGFRYDDHPQLLCLQLPGDALQQPAPIQRFLVLKPDIRHQHQHRLLASRRRQRCARGNDVLDVAVLLVKVAELGSGLNDPLTGLFIDSSLAG
ncbi:hypothetical protein D3C81_1409080 [compost metagenome]